MASFSVRVPDELHAQIRVISAFKNESLNTVVNEALEALVTQWEQKYGQLPSAPEEFQ